LQRKQPEKTPLTPQRKISATARSEAPITSPLQTVMAVNSIISDIDPVLFKLTIGMICIIFFYF